MNATTEKNNLLFVGLLMVLFLFLIADVMTGPAMLPVKEVLACLFHKSGASDNTRVIVWSMRLPVALMALVVGIALGTSGSVMQTILHNPLASLTHSVWGLPPGLALLLLLLWDGAMAGSVCFPSYSQC